MISASVSGMPAPFLKSEIQHMDKILSFSTAYRIPSLIDWLRHELGTNIIHDCWIYVCF